MFNLISRTILFSFIISTAVQAQLITDETPVLKESVNMAFRAFPFLALAGCKKDKTEKEIKKMEDDLPYIRSFSEEPSDAFILDDAGLDKVSRALPYYGQDSECVYVNGELGGHGGAHVHFTKDGAPYEVTIYAVAKGFVSRIDHCYASDLTDRFGIDLAIGKMVNGDIVKFHYSIEPLEIGQEDPFPCSSVTGDENFFAEYIFVEVGDEVKRGDAIAIYPRYADQEADGGHIHFNLLTETYNQSCPNIFTREIERKFAESNEPDEIGDLECDGRVIDPTFCYEATVEGEDIVTQPDMRRR